ncbi:hypothetical protein [Pseudomonas carnis]|uniref:hypothetical protein n=1 Tax=Pseudomonas carnis TaxID=2487355 RepID=UPI001969810E|nr:hypothetical protein [Pseudomonas carnis]
MDFPKWKYHPALAALVVETPDQEEALGEEWADTPFAKAESEAAGLANGSGDAGNADHRELFTKWIDYQGLNDEAPGVLNLLFDAFTARGRQGDAELYAEVPTEDEAETKRQKLLADAKELGLSLHPRTGAEKIQAAIDTKLAEV